MKPLIFGFLLLLGWVFLFITFSNYKQSSFLLENGKKTKALVIDLGEEQDFEGYEYTPIFEYQDEENNTITFVSNATSDYEPYSVGDSVEIVYFPNEPNTEVEISFFSLYGMSLIFGVLGLVFSVAGFGFLIDFYRNKK
ncbi:DUF3592 domain-containing protein [Bernardetia sp.]|uniref:DUF3592 domain-containing protein n=1 Tax=Bernardetia sp. TaxID=1937974 RepID=UPI0025B8E451|nr:DUF3592 domain-containing protein [Bernardetia sp.]